MKLVYGPVPSWRLGSSLGIDLISSRSKTCSFDCCYCQLGATVIRTLERREFQPLNTLAIELQEALSRTRTPPRFITFSGTGEPTLASNIGEAVDIVRMITDIPIALLTNSTLLGDDEVARALSSVDLVVAKLDASDDGLLGRMNNPVSDITLEGIVEGIRRFRMGFGGRLALQMMFIEANRESASRMGDLARLIQPDELQINTPRRTNPERALDREHLQDVMQAIGPTGFKAFTVYDTIIPEVDVLDRVAMEMRRPDEGV